MNKGKKELLDTPYEAKNFEKGIYEMWEKSGYFNPDQMVKDGLIQKDAKTFSMVLPPPNVTGTLHLGHALMCVIQDIMTRYHRMNGERSLWVPGTDSAALATQEKVEKELYKTEKLRRQDLGREEFLKRVNAFAKDSHDTIVNQVKSMGASLDWSREAYTLDNKRNFAVNEAFIRMYNLGLIEKGDYIVNWDPKMQTTVSDDEVDMVSEETIFYTFKYGPFEICTSRPETKFGDKYVVMHPKDERYAEWKHGDEVEVEWLNGKIKATIIKDEAIDMTFGTGCMTITPYHDATDFEIAKRHNLKYDQIIDFYGKLLPVAGESFAGLKIEEARKKAVETLREKSLIVKEEKYTHNVAVSSRGGGKIEPQIKKQWFVRVDKKFKIPQSKINGINKGDEVTLKQLMQLVVREKMVSLFPNSFESTYFNWIDNLRDWCISRQIWFGHRIPVWYKGDEMTATHEDKSSEGFTQEEDTLDTWFSSGLWTMSTLGWPEVTDDFRDYHPTHTLETGHDIIFFWVARMILMSTALCGDIPFKNVYLHGLVRDKNGKKMSKSLGNIIDPLTIIDLYGTDALRMGLIVGNPPGAELNFSEDKVRGYKKFGNKLWNISRFIVNETVDYDLTAAEIEGENKLLLEEMETVKKDIFSEIEKNNFHLASDKLYHYIWDRLADKILEESKIVFTGEGSDADKLGRRKVLQKILEEVLKLLHPFMPFITEVIWTNVLGKEKMLMVERL